MVGGPGINGVIMILVLAGKHERGKRNSKAAIVGFSNLAFNFSPTGLIAENSVSYMLSGDAGSYIKFPMKQLQHQSLAKVSEGGS